MMKFTLPRPDGGTALVLGLTNKEVERMQAGATFEVDLAAPLAGASITALVMLLRPTHHDLLEEFAPLIGPETTISGSVTEQDRE